MRSAIVFVVGGRRPRSKKAGWSPITFAFISPESVADVNSEKD